MEIREVTLTDKVVRELIVMSAEWEAEDISYGYRENTFEDLKGNRVFLAEENGEVIGYLFGKCEKAERSSAVMPKDTRYFELEELYVKPAFRSKGIGGALFHFAEELVRPEAGYIMVGTATKNFRAILHFYIDELGMEFWSARLFKKL